MTSTKRLLAAALAIIAMLAGGYVLYREQKPPLATDTARVIETVLSKVLADYQDQFESKGGAPVRLSIALVPKSAERGSLRETTIKRHWLYEDSALREATPDERTAMLETREITSTGLWKTGRVTFAIYREGRRTLVQIDGV